VNVVRGCLFVLVLLGTALAVDPGGQGDACDFTTTPCTATSCTASAAAGGSVTVTSAPADPRSRRPSCSP